MRIKLLKNSKWHGKSYPIGWAGGVTNDIAKKLIKSGNAMSDEPAPPPLTSNQLREIKKREIQQSEGKKGK
jgi:hypothetical protein